MTTPQDPQKEPKRILRFSGSYNSIVEAHDDIMGQLLDFLEHYRIPYSDLTIKKPKSQVNVIGREHRVITEFVYYYEKELPWPLPE